MDTTTDRPWTGEELQAHIRALLNAVQPGATVQVRDDTALHAGHNAAVGHNGGHYKVHVVWPGFAGHARVARQRMLMTMLAPLWAKRHIHALSLTCLTPEEAPARSRPVA